MTFDYFAIIPCTQWSSDHTKLERERGNSKHYLFIQVCNLLSYNDSSFFFFRYRISLESLL